MAILLLFLLPTPPPDCGGRPIAFDEVLGPLNEGGKMILDLRNGGEVEGLVDGDFFCEEGLDRAFCVSVFAPRSLPTSD
jgi:hypothetical protein